MANIKATSGIGQRIKELRKRRGYKSPKELAESIRGGNVTTAVLENVESGRKADLSVSQLMNIARALRVPPVYLLAAVTSPQSGLDLPNLSQDLGTMTTGEFEAWFSGVPGGDFRSGSAEERLHVEELQAYRMLVRLRRGLVRERAVLATLDPDSSEAIETRIDRMLPEIRELEDYLRSVGWDLGVSNEDRTRGSD